VRDQEKAVQRTTDNINITGESYRGIKARKLAAKTKDA
jgi:hypothetical protein